MVSKGLNFLNCRIGIVGLGYVGLPIAVEFGKHFKSTVYPGCTEEVCVPIVDPCFVDWFKSYHGYD
jgi:UDP-N-acetyl-D-mannosaminuronate dehydrogenase